MANYFNGPIQVEVDYLSLARTLEPGLANRTFLFPIVANIQTMLHKFSSYEMRWTKREQNKAAQCLAARAQSSGDFFQLGAVPDDLKEILVNDGNRLV